MENTPNTTEDDELFQQAWDAGLKVESIAVWILDTDYGDLRHNPDVMRALKEIAFRAWKARGCAAHT